MNQPEKKQVRQDPIRILLVDDSPYFLEAAQEFLQIHEPLALIEVASEEQEALAKSMVSAPDIILLDLNLTYISGLELIPLFRKHLPKVKIIVLTMMSDDSYRAAAMQAGADAFVNKSAMSKTLLSTMFSLLQREHAAPPAANSEATPEIEPRLLRLAEHLPDLIYRYEFAPVRGFTYVSPSAAAMTGYTPEDHYADPDLGYKLVHPEDVHLLQAVADGKADLNNPLVLRWVRKDGSSFWTEQRNMPIFDAHGNLIALEGVARDITERKRAEDALRESEARFSIAFFTNPAPQSILSLSTGHVVEVNDATCHLFGYTREELIGVDPATYNLWENPADELAVLEELQASGRLLPKAITIRRKSGEIRHILFAAEQISWNGEPCLITSSLDITERKQAEANLAYQANLIANISDAVVSTDAEMIIRSWNHAAERMFGYTAEEVIGQSARGLMSPEYIHTTREAVFEQLAATGRWTGEVCLRHKDGSLVYAITSGTLLREANGNATGYLAINHDITERRQAEEKLRQSEDRYRDLVENSSDLICTHDLDGTILSANAAATNMLGYDLAQILKMNIRDILTEEAAAQYKHYIDRIKRNGRGSGMMHIQTASGEKRIWEYNNSLRTDGLDQPLVRGMARDVTERELARQALQETQTRFASVIESAMDAVISVDENQNIVLFNSAAERMFGCESAQALGKSIERFIPNRYREAHTKHVSNFGRLGETSRSMGKLGTIHGLRTNGEEFPIEASISHTNVGGKPLFTVILRDMTERQQAEETLRNSEAALRKAQQVSHVGSWTWHIPDNRLEWSDEMYHIFGIERDTFSGNLQDVIARAIHPEDRPAVERANLSVIGEGKPVPMEYRVVWLDGTVRTVWAEAGEIVFDEAGKPSILTGIVQDISERKRAEKALQDSEVRYRSLFENSPIAVWEEDFSDVKRYLDSLRQREVKDFREYFASHPEEVTHCNLMIRVLDVNETGVKIYKAGDKKTLLDYTNRTITSGEQEQNPEDFIAIAEGRTSNGWEGRDTNPNGEALDIKLTWSVVPGHEADYSRVIVTTEDITERKRAEARLMESEARYRALFEQSHDAVFILDMQGNHITANQRAAHMLGYTVEEIQRLSVRETSAELDESLHIIERLLSGEHIPLYERRFRKKDGGIVPVEINLELVRDEGGNPLHIQSVVRDISGRKQAEEELAILSRFPAENPNPVVRLATDGKLLYANPPGAPLLDFWGTKVGDAVPEEWKALVTEVVASGEHREIEVETTGRIYSCILTPIREAGYVNIYGRDITEHRHAEEKVKRQLMYLNALRDIDRAITSSFDMQASLNTLIARTVQVLGVDAAAVLLLNPTSNTLEFSAGSGFLSDVIRSSSLKLGESYAGRAAIERQTVQIPDLAREPQNLFRSGFLEKERFAGYYGAPLIVKGKMIGVLEVFHRTVVERDDEWLDIFDTLAGQAAIAMDQAQMFENLQRTNAVLEHRVAERTAELNQTNLELQFANRAKDEFLANMSHELRTPLNSILGLSETMLEQRRDTLSEHQQRTLQIIESSGRHLLELINDVLDLSKIEAGKFDYYPQTIEIDALCQSSLSIVRQQAMRKLIELGLEEDPAVSKLYADPRRLKQILVNLLTNAVKFTPESGRVTLQVRSDVERDLIQFSVIDTGIGIAAEDLKKLFQPFSQVNSSLTREFEGTGLGLALVQRLADLHGGSVEVESQPNRGSRFTVNIPWNRDLVAQQEAIETGVQPLVSEPTGIPQAADRGKILLAEDNMANVLTIGEYLEIHGYEVVIASDGLQAIVLAEQTNPALILMDIQMPALDGLEAMRRLRNDPRFATTPMIALTALAMPGDREDCLEAGANEYMSKPVSLKMLVKTIESLLGAKQ